MEKIKILHIIHGLNLGGAENFIYNVIVLLGSEKYQFDFAIQNPSIRHTKLKELIEKSGGTIYLIPDFRKNPLGELISLRRIMGLRYDYVHIHMNALINPIPVLASMLYRNKVIIHSHNTSCQGGIIGRCVHRINSTLFIRNNIIRVACGSDAGKWMFGKKPFQVISNAVNLNSYRYNENSRAVIRKQYNLTDEFIIGQVGRLISVKNQEFSLHMLKAYKDYYPQEKVVMMFVGEGNMEMQLKELACKLSVDDCVIFTGGVSNPQEYYSAFDCLILPSLYEGFAFVAVEAQGAGLKLIVSTNNTSEIDLTGDVTFKSLDNIESWIDAVHRCTIKYDRKEISEKLVGTLYDDNSLKAQMIGIYL